MPTARRTRRPALPAARRAASVVALALFLVAAPALAGDGPRSGGARGATYEVTITNLTYDQIISPPVAVVHDERFDLFQPGQPASPELAALAEDGMTGPLAGLIQVSPGVADHAVAGGGIPPGASITLELTARGRARLLSLAGMLVSTNDAFVGLDGYALPGGFLRPFGELTVDLPAYDAGSEANTESCDHIPGPPCGSPEMRVTDGAEGFVFVHRGVLGQGDLDAAAKDWNNPAARVGVRRIDP